MCLCLSGRERDREGGRETDSCMDRRRPTDIRTDGKPLSFCIIVYIDEYSFVRERDIYIICVFQMEILVVQSSNNHCNSSQSLVIISKCQH